MSIERPDGISDEVREILMEHDAEIRSLMECPYQTTALVGLFPAKSKICRLLMDTLDVNTKGDAMSRLSQFLREHPTCRSRDARQIIANYVNFNNIPLPGAGNNANDAPAPPGDQTAEDVEEVSDDDAPPQVKKITIELKKSTKKTTKPSNKPSPKALTHEKKPIVYEPSDSDDDAGGLPDNSEALARYNAATKYKPDGADAVKVTQRMHSGGVVLKFSNGAKRCVPGYMARKFGFVLDNLPILMSLPTLIMIPEISPITLRLLLASMLRIPINPPALMLR